jgi:hypothetical protein
MQAGQFVCPHSAKLARQVANDLQVTYDEEVDLGLALPIVGLTITLQGMASPKPKYVPACDVILHKYQELLLSYMLPHLGTEELGIAALSVQREQRGKNELVRWNANRKQAETPKERSLCSAMCALYSAFPIAYRMVFVTKHYLDLENYAGTGVAALANLENWLQGELK